MKILDYYRYLQERAGKAVTVLYREKHLSESYLPSKLLVEPLFNRLLLTAYQTLASLFLDELNRKDLLMPYLGGDAAAADAVAKSEQEFADTLCREGEDYLSKNAPSLARKLDEIERMYFEFVLEMIIRIRQDSQDLSISFYGGREINQISGLTIDAGDSHNNGRTTVIVSSDAGKFVYKPHDLGLNTIMSELAAQFLPGMIRIADTLSRDGYGYEKFIENKAAEGKEAAALYYRNFGRLCAVFYFLGSKDLHLENILSDGIFPVPIDLEMIVNPENRKQFGAAEQAEDDIRRSLYGSGLLPMRKDGLEMSPLFSVDDRNKSCPVIAGEKVNVVPFREAFFEGFDECYRLAMGQKDSIAAFMEERLGNVRIRILLRATAPYSKLVQKLNSPGWLNATDTEAEVLSALARGMNKNGILNEKAVCVAETEALMQNDIPYFYTTGDSVNLYSTNGLVMKDYFGRNTADTVAEYILSLTEEGLRFEKDLLQLSMQKQIRSREKDASDSGQGQEKTARNDAEMPGVGPTAITPVHVLSEEECLKEAEQIFVRIEEDALHLPSGDLCFMGTDASMRSGMSKLDFGVYSGMMGIALFFAAVSRESGSEEIRARARAGYENILHQFSGFLSSLEEKDVIYEENCNLSYAGGVAGFCFALEMLGEITGRKETALLHRVLDLVPRLDLSYSHSDMLLGIAGFIKVACRFEDIYSYPGIKETIEILSDLLLQRRKDLGAAVLLWEDTEPGVALSGAAHGQIGIASALEAAGRKLGKEEYLHAAEDACAYEEKIYEEGKGWPDYRKQAQAGSFMCGYCAGAPGIGHIYLESGRIDALNFTRALELCVKAELTYEDSLCCGNTARAELLMEAADRLREKRYRDKAIKILSEMAERAHRSGDYIYLDPDVENIFIPGLYSGAAGIGYELLRIHHPEEIKTVFL